MHWHYSQYGMMECPTEFFMLFHPKNVLLFVYLCVPVPLLRSLSIDFERKKRMDKVINKYKRCTRRNDRKNEKSEGRK